MSMSKNAKKRKLAEDIWKLRNENNKKQKHKALNNNCDDSLRNHNSSIDTTKNNCNVPRSSATKSQKSIEKDNKFLNKLKNAPTIVIDMDYDDKMTESEQKSLSQQIMYCYGSNKRAKKPFKIFLSKLNGNTEKCLNKISGFPNNWLGCDVDHECKGYEELFDHEKLVYLSADSPHVLETIDDHKIYILGGIVDRNRYKNITYEKALKQNIQTARFPLQKYCTINSGTHILTVNHCYDILLSRYNSDNWINTFKSGIPSRKDLTIKSEFIDDGINGNDSCNGNNKKAAENIENAMKKKKSKRNKKSSAALPKVLLNNSKLAVVVGGSNGIGYGFASSLLNNDITSHSAENSDNIRLSYTILLVGRNEKRLNDAKLKLQSENRNNQDSQIFTFKCDCTKKAECYILRDYIRTTFGKKRGTISLLVNSAGTFLWDKDVPNGEDPKLYLENLNFNTKKYVLESLIPLMLPEKYKPLIDFQKEGTSPSMPTTTTMVKTTTTTFDHPHIILIGSQAGQPNFKEDMEKKEGKGAADGEMGYIHAMANLRSWALKMKNRMAQKGVVLNLLEPGLIDTNLSRTNFSHFGIDWKTTIKPLEYAKEEMRKMI
jgi:tRNA (guanine9-N1)-methyltransferase